MKGYNLEGLWKEEHDLAFLRLKVALISEPVLKGPKYDGTPFIVTTDGCKYGFAVMSLSVAMREPTKTNASALGSSITKN